MEDIKQDNQQAVKPTAPANQEVKRETRSANRPDGHRGERGGRGGGRRPDGHRGEARPEQEYEQQILDLARVTRVMAGGKRMRFRACVVLGNKAGKVGLGLAKGADVTMAVNKAVMQAKKKMIDVPLTADASIPHEITHKFGAGYLLLRPAKHGRGIICGGVMRRIAEVAGIKNITGKILGTNNNVTNAKCMVEALSLLKKTKKTKIDNKPAVAAEESAA